MDSSEATGVSEAIEIESRSAADTESVGVAISGVLTSGDVILLSGPLGAGKSALVRGVAKGMGIEESVTSPTFVIVKTYETGRLPLRHVDLYRLESVQDLFDLGYEDLFEGDAVVAVEWGEAAIEVYHGPRLEVRIDYSASGAEGDAESRSIKLTPVGDEWGVRLARLGLTAC